MQRLLSRRFASGRAIDPERSSYTPRRDGRFGFRPGVAALCYLHNFTTPENTICG
jgi:hypothetical protein